MALMNRCLDLTPSVFHSFIVDILVLWLFKFDKKQNTNSRNKHSKTHINSLMFRMLKQSSSEAMFRWETRNDM